MKDLEEILQYRRPAPKRYQKAKADRVQGVYFLFEENEIVYIGRSVDIYERLYNHKRRGISFDSFCYLEIEYEQLLLVEKKYIKQSSDGGEIFENWKLCFRQLYYRRYKRILCLYGGYFRCRWSYRI